VGHLRAAGGEVTLQAFTQREPKSQVDYQLTNIIARFNPDRSVRVILGSHWDTRLWAEEDADAIKRELPITGANDGSSGVAVLLEIARQLQALQLKGLGVDVVLFDGEEFGRPGSQDYCAGSRYFAQHLTQYYPQVNPAGVIVIDMVGDRDLTFPPEQSSIAKARDLTTLIWREGVRLRAPAFIAGLRGTRGVQPRSRWIIDDHTPFQKLNIPAVLVIDLDYAQWHTHQDTMDRVSAASLKQTGDVLIASLLRLDQNAVSSSSRSPHDRPDLKSTTQHKSP
jgi:Zn-dependent M28 family amino/carboxypeptidase